LKAFGTDQAASAESSAATENLSAND